MGPAMITVGLVLIVLALRPNRPRPSTFDREVDALQPIEIIEHWSPLRVDRPEHWELELHARMGDQPTMPLAQRKAGRISSAKTSSVWATSSAGQAGVR